MRTCPKCCKTTVTKANFCYEDGMRLSEGKKCSCGEYLTTYDIYCSNCGKKVEASHVV